MLDPAPISGSNAAASALKENALVWNAAEALSGGVVMNRPPSASSGANAIACSAPSTLPHRSRSESVNADRSSGLFTSSSSTSTSAESRVAARSVIRRARPKLVSTSEAPSSRARSAAWKAIESFVITPVTTSFLPSRITTSRRRASTARRRAARACPPARSARRRTRRRRPRPRADARRSTRPPAASARPRRRPRRATRGG